MMFQSNLFDGKTVLVTGGGSGIGFDIAEKFLDLGAEVYIASRKEDRLQEACEKLSEHGNCRYVVCDIRQLEEVEQMAGRIEEESDGLDILINNAGGQFPSLAEDISPKGWRAVIDTNLNGSWNVTQTMANRFFIPRKSGAIVNIIVNIYRGFPGMSHTGAARAGIDNLTKSLAVEWSKYDIRINAVAPGIIHSSGLKNYPQEMVEGIAETIPLKRLGSTEEVAWLTLFLTSPMAAYITGETVYIDGGQRLWGQIFEL